MNDIKEIPTTELIADWTASYADVALCLQSIQDGKLTYGKGESVHERLDANRNIVGAIQMEMERRYGDASTAKSYWTHGLLDLAAKTSGQR